MKRDLRQAVEVVGIFGVIASLIFVGMQLRLDRQIAISEQYHNRAESRLESLRNSQNNTELVRDRMSRWENNRPAWWTNEIENLIENGSESMYSLVAQQFTFSIFVVAFDNNYFQYQQGLLDEGFWQSLREDFKGSLRHPFAQAYVHTIPVSEATQYLIADLLNEVDEGR